MLLPHGVQPQLLKVDDRRREIARPPADEGPRSVWPQDPPPDTPVSDGSTSIVFSPPPPVATCSSCTLPRSLCLFLETLFDTQVDAHDSAEAAQEDAILKEEGVAEIEEERSTQIAAVADGIDPKKEAARICERHIRDAVSCLGLSCRWSRKHNNDIRAASRHYSDKNIGEVYERWAC